ncbi:acetyl-CoA carboxylase biotin carboxyl carrier protein subunit [Pelagicoccus sp. NFK12]|uniref:Acetyl-CoA carboxylase biotin carboxyl carrier protein subunit n=1 Tax=Pelagicoccus enzymogenes TaxID=2773457 RepID=A0A927F899_9BACT|nr:acetyl-CoA carboxylase biotin carboxyl carrier protein subunit [Pelagicoccus enzymogenes]MBD5780293.1 acetyl-CoA carboxylase biotin carboxyl carrier protein subunit [Pelagicoccus enzymogenes]MDQ8197804.1 acetyl-CoA carboxylase biotin carboxyl carrier protein subunit [Pelagicoccus enzymogenes]
MKHLRITIEGKTYDVDVEILGEENEPVKRSSTQGRSRPAAVAAPVAAAPAAPAPAAGSAPAAAGDVPSPLSGKVVSVDVKVGDSVAAGDQVVTLEAMKMNTIVSAPTSGTVTAIHVSDGQSVDEGGALLTLS